MEHLDVFLSLFEIVHGLLPFGTIWNIGYLMLLFWTC